MRLTCDYCRSAYYEAEAVKCVNCGAPLDAAAATAPDYRRCPHCGRRLLALGSPACNHCGRALPAEYLKAREATRQRINEFNSQPERAQDDSDAFGEDTGVVRRLLGDLFGLDEKPRRK